VETKLTTIHTLAIGNLIMYDQKFHVVDFPAGELGAPVGDAVGYELLRRLTVRVDYEHGELSFFDAPKFRYAGDGVRVPMHLDAFTLEVNGSVEGVPGTFSLDTGNEVAFELASEYVHRNHLIEKLGAPLSRVRGTKLWRSVTRFILRGSARCIWMRPRCTESSPISRLRNRRPEPKMGTWDAAFSASSM